MAAVKLGPLPGIEPRRRGLDVHANMIPVHDSSYLPSRGFGPVSFENTRESTADQRPGSFFRLSLSLLFRYTADGAFPRIFASCPGFGKKVF